MAAAAVFELFEQLN